MALMYGTDQYLHCPFCGGINLEKKTLARYRKKEQHDELIGYEEDIVETLITCPKCDKTVLRINNNDSNEKIRIY